MKAKRKVKCNIWGNWIGYTSGRKVLEFGNDDVSAGHWLLTGEYGNLEGYASQETIKAARIEL